MNGHLLCLTPEKEWQCYILIAEFYKELLFEIVKEIQAILNLIKATHPTLWLLFEKKLLFMFIVHGTIIYENSLM